MSRTVQQVRMGSAALAATIGAPGQIIADSDTNDLTYHDGVTAGGHRLPNEANIAGFSVRAFTAVYTASIPGALAAGDVNTKHVDFTNAGTYDLPLLADIGSIGDVIEIQAQVAGVQLDCQGADQISDHGVDDVTMSLTRYEVVRIAKKSSARYVVISRY